MKEIKLPKCTFCWDKGWSSELTGGHYIAGDFEGDKSYHTGMIEVKRYCMKCKKGRKMARQQK